MKRKIVAAALAVLCVALLAACAGQPREAAIIGTWRCLDDSAPHRWVCFLVFDENGRFTDKDGDEGYFSIDGNTLTLDFDDFPTFTFTFRVSSSQLLITADGVRIMLTRQ